MESSKKREKTILFLSEMFWTHNYLIKFICEIVDYLGMYRSAEGAKRGHVMQLPRNDATEVHYCGVALTLNDLHIVL